jgi:hypothetical protein
MNLIQCFSNVIGHKEAQELVVDLNNMKSSQSEDFYIYYNKFQDYTKDDNYLVIGNVTKKDWDELNLSNDFMRSNLFG